MTTESNRDGVGAKVRDYTAKAEYPGNALAEKLRFVAQLIVAEMETRIYYVELAGFDTHSRQADAHHPCRS